MLGDKRYAATRINLAQSCNGVGWILGPIVGSIFFYSKDAQGNSTGSQMLYVPYVRVSVVVIVLAAIFYFSKMPDIKAEDDFHLDDPASGARHSIWAHPHFAMAVAAQFFYVAAQAGIFSFFINYMTAEIPPVPKSWASGMAKAAGQFGIFEGWLSGWFETAPQGVLALSNKGASNLASLGFVCFLAGRFSGALLLKRYPAHRILGIYGARNVMATLLVFFKLGWLSVACVFLSYFFMSIMFPTIFALGIFGLGSRAKKASAFIVMAIVGGALLPKLMGCVGDVYDMSRGFIVPAFCFAAVAAYGFSWPRLSRVDTSARNRTGHASTARI